MHPVRPLSPKGGGGNARRATQVPLGLLVGALALLSEEQTKGEEEGSSDISVSNARYGSARSLVS